MARRRRGRRGHKSKSIPVAPVLPVAWTVMSSYKDAGGLNQAMLEKLMNRTIGYNTAMAKWSMDGCKAFWGAEVAAIIVHKVAGKVGLNKVISRFSGGYLTL